MKFINVLVIILSISFYSCWTISRNGMGEQKLDNIILPMDDIYNVLVDNFPDYNIRLDYTPGSSSFMIFPRWGRVYSQARHSIYMYSDNYSIIIQYSGVPHEEFTGILIWYYLKGENIYERIDELREPMEKIKQCLINNFSEYLTNDDFIEQFMPLPIH